MTKVTTLAELLRRPASPPKHPAPTLLDMLTEASDHPARREATRQLRTLHEIFTGQAINPVFVSFDWDNDRHYKFLLGAWHKNPRFRFVFQDETPGEIETNNVGRIKAALTAKINDATHTLVIVGRHANEPHRKRHLIGYRNWINFEIHQSKLARKKIVAVKIDRSYESPDELLDAGASWALTFAEDPILRALAQA